MRPSAVQRPAPSPHRVRLRAPHRAPSRPQRISPPRRTAHPRRIPCYRHAIPIRPAASTHRVRPPFAPSPIGNQRHSPLGPADQACRMAAREPGCASSRSLVGESVGTHPDHPTTQLAAPRDTGHGGTTVRTGTPAPPARALVLPGPAAWRHANKGAFLPPRQRGICTQSDHPPSSVPPPRRSTPARIYLAAPGTRIAPLPPPRQPSRACNLNTPGHPPCAPLAPGTTVPSVRSLGRGSRPGLPNGVTRKGSIPPPPTS